MSEPLSTPELRERLCRWLQLQIPRAQQLEISEFTSPEAGASNETLLFTASWLEEGERRERGLVARLKPSGGKVLFRDEVLLPEPAVALLGAQPTVSDVTSQGRD